MDRRATPTRRVTSFNRGLPPPLKQALNKFVLYGALVICLLYAENEVCAVRMRERIYSTDFELSCAVFLIKVNMTIVFFFSEGTVTNPAI